MVVGLVFDRLLNQSMVWYLCMYNISAPGNTSYIEIDRDVISNLYVPAFILGTPSSVKSLRHHVETT
jgi:hypothetical protein